MLRNNKPKKMPRDLAKAVRANDVGQVSAILSDQKYLDPAWLNAVNGSGRTALQLALKYNCLDVAGLLLNRSAIDLNVVDRYGHTLLDLSAGDADIFLRILNAANAPALTDSVATKAASLAIDTNRLDLFKALIAKGINVNAIDCNRTILERAVEKCRTQFVKILLEQHGINVNHNQPLVIAAHIYHLEILTLLVNHPDINVNLHNGTNYPITALHFPCQLDSNRARPAQALMCLKVLLSHPKIDKQWFKECDAFMKWVLNVSPNLFRNIINLPTSNIFARRHKASHERIFEFTYQYLDAIHVLINDPDFDINMLTWDGHTLLTMAIDQHNHGIVNALLDCLRIDLHLQDKFGHTALTQADASGNQDLVTAIMQHPRFNILATYKHKQNLLMLAVKMDCAHLVRILLRTHHFDVNAADADGNTALILLANHHKNANDATLFTELLEHGADPTQKNSKGINAVMAAKDSGLKGIAHELKNATPRAVIDRHAGASAPNLEDLETDAAIAKAAAQPPSGYYLQGLFAPEAREQPASPIENQSTQTHQKRPE